MLLHALLGLSAQWLEGVEIRAVHVNHGLNAEADVWSRHCAVVCSALALPCQILHVNAKAQSGESPEAAARGARYQAITALMDPGDVLLTAHHQDDQAETLLLQLLRGAGPHGIAAMPAYAPFGVGWLARPLLDVTADELASYAEQHQLAWVEDPSNFDTGFERNYLRHEVMPHLKRRWPAVSRTLSRAAAHAAEAANLLDTLADNDMQPVQGPTPDTLSVGGLLKLDEAHQRNVLRRWFKGLDLAVPTAIHLRHIQHDILNTAADSVPCVGWGSVNQGAETRRYRDLIYAMRRLPAHNPADIFTWDIRQPLTLAGAGTFTAVSVLGAGIKASLFTGQSVDVRFRQGGELCRPAGRGHTHELRKLFQECGIPPWRRDRLPLIYIGDELAAVANLWVCEPFQATHNEPGMMVK